MSPPHLFHFLLPNRLDALSRHGGQGGHAASPGRVQAGEASPLPPRPVPHHTEVLGRGPEQEAGLQRA